MKCVFLLRCLKLNFILFYFILFETSICWWSWWISTKFWIIANPPPASKRDNKEESGSLFSSNMVILRYTSLIYRPARMVNLMPIIINEQQALCLWKVNDTRYITGHKSCELYRPIETDLSNVLRFCAYAPFWAGGLYDWVQYAYG